MSECTAFTYSPNKIMRDFKSFELDWYYTHYSCNAPKESKLKKHNIEMIWELFGIPNKEVVKIPVNVFKKFWMFGRSREEIQINCEKLMKIL